MIHELLLALFGFEGDVFLTEKGSGYMKVVESFPYLHASEISLLNRICRLGSYYQRFQAFIAGQGRPSVTLLRAAERGEGDNRRGLYLRALADGLNTVLQDYRQTLLRVEKKALADPHLPITQVEHELEEYQLLFPAINDLLETVSERKSHGCQVLSLLHQRKVCGVLCVEKTMERLLFTCHGVLYRQLAAWMLHGLLLDDHCEFFVEQERAAVKEPLHPEEEKAGKQQGGDEGAGAKKVTFTADTRQEKKSMIRKEEAKTPAVAHTLNHTMLPSYLTVRLAEKVLFVGEALQLFKRDPQKHELEVEQTSSNLLTKEDEARFGTLLSELQKQPIFSIWDFETAINTIRDHVSKNLWKLMVQDSDLVGHLQTVKDFFLLGRGELFLCFNDHAQMLLRKPVTETSEHDVNVAFQQSLHKVGIDDESITNHFKLTLPPRQEKGGGRPPSSGGGGWSSLGLAYSPPWPLHILFTPQILHRYNELFRFLLSVRRVHTMLQEAWEVQMQHKERAAEMGLLWQLRSQMAFLVDNLQYYVQVDVLESQFSLLLGNITSTLDFESIKLSHEHFVATLQGQLFLSMPSVFSCLCDILDTCTSFSAILHATDLIFTSRDREQINLLAKDFHRHASLLFRLLSDVKSHHHSPHLSQMMLRIDYNKFFSSSCSAVVPFPAGTQKTETAVHPH